MATMQASAVDRARRRTATARVATRPARVTLTPPADAFHLEEEGTARIEELMRPAGGAKMAQQLPRQVRARIKARLSQARGLRNPARSPRRGQVRKTRRGTKVSKVLPREMTRSQAAKGRPGANQRQIPLPIGSHSPPARTKRPIRHRVPRLRREAA